MEAKPIRSKIKRSKSSQSDPSGSTHAWPSKNYNFCFNVSTVLVCGIDRRGYSGGGIL